MGQKSHKEEDTGHRKDKDVEIRQSLECGSVSHRSRTGKEGVSWGCRGSLRLPLISMVASRAIRR